MKKERVLKKASRRKRRSTRSVSKLKREADRVFSLWIRRRDKYICFTCGAQKTKDTIQNGHYISRSISSLRYDEMNCHAQCVACNIFKHGNMDAYALHLQDTYGPGILKYLAKKKQEIHQFKAGELEAIIAKYR